MKVAAITGEREAGLVDKPDPVAYDDFVIIKIHVVPMCTEYKRYVGGQPADNLGHEAVGEVVEVAQPGQVKVGDRVVVQCGSGCGDCALCRTGDVIHCLNSRSPNSATATYAQYTLKSDYMCSPIPDDVSYKHAGVALCGLGPGFSAMEMVNVQATDTVLITGLGPVGLGGVINGSYRGARVIAVDSVPFRANLAKELGAAEVLDPRDENILEQILDLTGGAGVDKALDFSGVAPAHRLMIDATRRKGHCAFIGEGGEFPLGASRDMIRKGLVLHGSWHYNLALFPKLMRVIQDSGEKLDKFITHEFPMSEVAKAFELQSTGACAKVMLDPWK